MNMLIVVPTFQTINTETYESIWKLATSQDSNDHIDMDFKAIAGYDCARARNEAVKYFLEQDKYDYIMMVDSDIIMPKDLTRDGLYNMLRKVSADLVLGWYPRKSNPTNTEIFMVGYQKYYASARWNCNEIKHWPSERIQISGGGFGCAIIPNSLIQKLRFPYFKYDLRDDGTYISEDLYFCDRVKEVNHKIWTYKSLGCNHIGKQVIEA